MEDTKITESTIGDKYLNKLAVHIYSKYGHSFFDYEKDKNDTELLLKIINHNQLDITFNLDEDSMQILDNSDNY